MLLEAGRGSRRRTTRTTLEEPRRDKLPLWFSKEVALSFHSNQTFIEDPLHRGMTVLALKGEGATASPRVLKKHGSRDPVLKTAHTSAQLIFETGKDVDSSTLVAFVCYFLSKVSHKK